MSKKIHITYRVCESYSPGKDNYTTETKYRNVDQEFYRSWDKEVCIRCFETELSLTTGQQRKSQLIQMWVIFYELLNRNLLMKKKKETQIDGSSLFLLLYFWWVKYDLPLASPESLMLFT